LCSSRGEKGSHLFQERGGIKSTITAVKTLKKKARTMERSKEGGTLAFVYFKKGVLGSPEKSRRPILGKNQKGRV